MKIVLIYKSYTALENNYNKKLSNNHLQLFVKYYLDHEGLISFEDYKKKE